MKKLAFSDSTNTVYVAMSPQEFKSVTKVGQATVADGTNTDISWIKDMVAVVEGKRAELTTVAAKATEFVTSIKAVL